MTGHARTDIPSLVAAYIRNAQGNTDEFWAWEEVKDRVYLGSDAEDAWNVVTALVNAAPDDQLGYIGAGPLEDLVVCHGAGLVDRIEGEARRNPAFMDALSCVWLDAGHLPADAEARIVVASGHAIKLFR
jgi:hypothetical protein